MQIQAIQRDLNDSLDQFHRLVCQLVKAAQEADPKTREWIIQECDEILLKSYQTSDLIAKLLKDLESL